MKIEVREDRLKKCTLPCLKSEWNGINFFCFSRSHEEILSNVMTWFSLKSWSRTRAILRWFHGFSTNTDASPGYYALPGHYASPGLEQQFNVGSSHDFFWLMFRIFILPPLFRVTSHHHHSLCMLDSICWTSIFFCISLSWFHFLKIDYKKLSTLLVLQIRSRDAAAAESWFLIFST